jgi:Tol biopolymer transport system component
MQIGVYTSGQSIFTIPITGGKPHFLTMGDSLGHTWSPDGKALAYFFNRSLNAVSMDSGVSKKIANAPESHSPAWSPDGRWIAFVSGNPQMLFVPAVIGNVAPSSIMIADVKTGEKRPLTDSVTSNTSPVWMPDSKSILFISSRGGRRDVWELRLSDGGKAIGQPVRVTAGLDAITLDVSSDGRILTFSKLLLKSNLVSIAIPKSGTVSPAEATFLTTGTQIIEGANISRDGKWIVFDSNRERSCGNEIFWRPLRGRNSENTACVPDDDKKRLGVCPGISGSCVERRYPNKVSLAKIRR